MSMVRINNTAVTWFLVTVILLFGILTPAVAEKAVDNYRLYCVQCHGSKGTGKGINATHLSVQPRNHTSAKDMSELRDDDVYKAIKGGGIAMGKSTQMPPFKEILTEDEIKSLVTLLRQMCKCVGKE